MPTPLQLRNGVAALAVLAERDLAALWRLVSTAEQAKAALSDVLPALVERYGAAATAIAADWYDDLREELEVRGRFTAIVADLGDLGTDELAGWGVGPLFAADPDWDAAKVLVAGGLQRRIANAARDTVAGSSVADPRATGWQRVGRGASSCAFCRMLIGRGSVYTEGGVKFGAHDHCNCAAVPAFEGHPLPVEPYTPSQRGTNPLDRDRAKKWIAENL